MTGKSMIPPPRTGGPRQVFETTVLFVASTALAFLTQDLERPITSALIYVLGVSIIGARQGPLAGFVSGISASIVYNFAIAEPVFAFRFTQLHDLTPPLAFIACALISGVLSGRLNERAQEAVRSAAELAALLDVSRALQRAVTLADLCAELESLAPNRYGGKLLLIAADTANAMRGEPQLATAPEIDALARETIKGNVVASPPGWRAHRLSSSGSAIGVLLVEDLEKALVRPGEAAFDAFLNVVAISLERCLLHERLAASEVIERSEAFKTSLLSSVSHDMRTPLATISASVTGLLEYSAELSAEAKLHLLTAIKEQGDRLNRYTANLLNLSRLQAGIDVAQLPVVDLIDVVGGALNAIRPTLESRTIVKAYYRVELPIRADPILLEQVVLNILDNAVRYSADGSAITVVVDEEPEAARIEIIDQGIGIPRHALERVFDRFYRIDHSGAVSGSGLGLAIAKGFVEAVGGTIRAMSPGPDGAGTVIVIRLPRATADASADLAA